jgi:putative peptide-modifying radical SAM enzyme
MYFHLILTDNCNLSCSYCRAKAFEGLEESESEHTLIVDEDLPVELDFDLNLLYKFLIKDPAPVLTFYGGEPLLRADLVERIVREAPARRFILQTNGLLLDRLSPKIVNRLSTILVSLDGRRELTDANRGDGVYSRVMRNIRKIKSAGFAGELIARMTVTEKTDIMDAVRYLASNPDYSFSSIHWQIDANFAGDFLLRRFEGWAEGSYNPKIRSLVQYWVDHMENCGEVLRWYPFLDPMEDLLSERESRLRCGSGYANYSIMTDGSIGPCPVMIGMTQYYVGHISRSHPLKLDPVLIRGECDDCAIRTFCGGRCLYSNITQPWGSAERGLVCSTVQNLHDALVTALPRVRVLLNEGTVIKEDFIHEKFNGCEIIP